MPVSSTSSLIRSKPVSFRMQKAEPLSPADHRQTMRMRILKKLEAYGDETGSRGGIVGGYWDERGIHINIEDSMASLGVLRKACFKPQTQGSCHCPFHLVWEKPMKPPWKPMI